MVVNKHAPLKKIRISQKEKKTSFINTEEIKALRNLKEHYHKLFISSNNPQHFSMYKTIKNRLTKCIRVAKS